MAVKFKGKDGHELDSREEMLIDNFLYEYFQDLPHLVHPTLPGSKFKADWKIGDIYIEYWGMAGNPKYDEEMERKRHYYLMRQSMVCIEIYPEDFKNGKMADRLNSIPGSLQAKTQGHLNTGNKTPHSYNMKLSTYHIAEEIAREFEGELLTELETRINSLNSNIIRVKQDYQDELERLNKEKLKYEREKDDLTRKYLGGSM